MTLGIMGDLIGKLVKFGATTTAVSGIAGLVHGACDAYNVDIGVPSEVLLTVGPALACGGYVASKSLKYCNADESLGEKAGGAAVFGVPVALGAGALTALGYCAGYTIAKTLGGN